MAPPIAATSGIGRTATGSPKRFIQNGADVLINNAGLSPLAPSSLETSEELFDKIIAVNLKGPFRLTALFASRMMAGDGGAVINISSTTSIRPDPETAPYGAAKAGLNILTVACAKEYGPKVRVNCIMCGPFHADISKGWSRTDDFTRRAKQTFPLQRAGEPEEVVGGPRCTSRVRRRASPPAPS